MMNIKRVVLFISIACVVLNSSSMIDANGLSYWIQSEMDFQQGNFSNLTITSESVSLQRYSNINDNWRKMNPGDPCADGGRELIYDKALDELVLFGGYDDLDNGMTWIYNLSINKWTCVNPQKSPCGRYGHAMVYDETIGKTVMLGREGYYENATWIFNSTNKSWTEIASPSCPNTFGSAMVYDSVNEVSIHFGGAQWIGPGSLGYSNETWTYDASANNWSFKACMNTPPARYEHAMAFDRENGIAVMFGGRIWENSNEDMISFNDTWVYNLTLNQWMNKTPNISPLAIRDCHLSYKMVYDEAHRDILMFGNDETWTYDATKNSWTNCTDSEKPQQRGFHALAYDSITEKTVLFGGVNISSRFGDMWMFDLNNKSWTGIKTQINPSKRYDSTMGYDEQNHLAVLFGGRDSWGYTSGHTMQALMSGIILSRRILRPPDFAIP
jgi:Galactose oxidase, central domain